MFPKRGQVWTYRERGRFISLIWVIPVVFFLAAGLYFAFAESQWLLLIIALLMVGFLGLFFFSSERKHRGEP